MFSKKISGLLSRCDPAALTPPTARLSAQLESRLQAIMLRQDGTMTLFQRRNNPREWARLQRLRRDDLEALVTAPQTPERTEKTLDLICQLCEEADWASPASGAPMQDMAHPAIDLQCAETACLLGWAQLALDKRVPERLPGFLPRVLHEARRRLFTPILSHEDYPFMSPGCPGAVSVLCSALTAVVLLETDVSRRNAALRRLARLLDDTVPGLNALHPMESFVADACAVSDLAKILRQLSHDTVDLCDQYPENGWLDAILAAHAAGAQFFNPAGQGMQPAVSGADVYRLGADAGDDALCALGAALHRLNPVPPASVNGRFLSGELRQAISLDLRRPPRLRQASAPGLFTALCGDFLCGLYTGGTRGNAGDVAVFLEDRPLFADGGRGCSARSLPVVGGCAPLEAPPAPEGDCDFSRERAMMSVDLTGTYPRGAGLRAYQRTLMAERREECVRLIDMLDLIRDAAVVFRFVVAQKPQLSRDGMGLGNTWFGWQGEPRLRAEAVSSADFSGDLWLVTLEYDQPAGRQMYSFDLERT